MIQTTARAVARCEDCSKAYRVPDPDRAYACKACGGIVHTVDLQDDLDPWSGEMVLCPDCQALNPSENEVCLECEADLEGADLVEDEEEAADLLDEANRAFRRASPWGRGISWTYHFGALAYAVATLLAVMALKRTDVPLGGGILVVVLTTLLSVLMGTAALHLLFRPFRWTLAVALLATGVAIVHAVGPNPLGIALIGSAAWAVLSWILLVPAKEFQTLIVRHKDLYVLHHASQKTKRALKGRSPGDRHSRLMRAMRRADRRAWKITAAAALALIAASTLGTIAVLTRARPQAFDIALAEFEAAWNGGKAQDIAPFFDPRVRADKSTWLAAVTGGHGWGEALPTLPQGTRREEPKWAYVDYDLGELTLNTSFLLDDLRWRLAEVVLPVPPIEPTLERFRAAWHAADPAALATFFAPENRSTRQETLEKSKARRGWDVFPSILSTDLQPDGERKAIATMSLGEDQVVTKWFFRNDGNWGLYGLEMPKIQR